MGGDDNEEPAPPICQYRGYRNGPEDGDKYGLSPQYWHVFAARLAFVVIFEVTNLIQKQTFSKKFLLAHRFCLDWNNAIRHS